MPGAAGVNVIPAEGRCAQRPSFPRTRESREKQSTPLPHWLRERVLCATTVIPAKAGIQRGGARGKRSRTGPEFIIGEVTQITRRGRRSNEVVRAEDARGGGG